VMSIRSGIHSLRTRRLFDRLLELSDKEICGWLRSTGIVAERNSMLSSGFYNEPLNEVLSDRIDTISQKWREKRQAFLQLVQASLNLRFPQVFDSSYSFKFSVETSDIKNLSLEMLKKTTLFGFQRDKVLLSVNNKELNTVASRGFLKILLTFVFVRTAELIHEKQGYVLLLWMTSMRTLMNSIGRKSSNFCLKGISLLLLRRPGKRLIWADHTAY